MKNIGKHVVCAVLVLSGLCAMNIALADANTPLEQKSGYDLKTVERGRYLLRTSGCNDCHTPGYPLFEGKTPEDLWLTGDTFGWRGPWGTTYGANLRLLAGQMGGAVGGHGKDPEDPPANALVQPQCHDGGGSRRHVPVSALSRSGRQACACLCPTRSGTARPLCDVSRAAPHDVQVGISGGARRACRAG